MCPGSVWALTLKCQNRHRTVDPLLTIEGGGVVTAEGRVRRSESLRGLDAVDLGRARLLHFAAALSLSVRLPGPRLVDDKQVGLLPRPNAVYLYRNGNAPFQPPMMSCAVSIQIKIASWIIYPIFVFSGWFAITPNTHTFRFQSVKWSDIYLLRLSGGINLILKQGQNNRSITN